MIVLFYWGQRFEHFDNSQEAINEFAIIMQEMGFETNISPYVKNDKN
jgi:hypothetical protein